MKSDDAPKKSYRTRLKIMDAYIELMQTKDFDSIPVKAIVEKANITRGTFYLYFSNIYEVVSYIEEALLADMPFSDAPDQSVSHKLHAPTYEECQDNAWEQSWFEYYNTYHIQFNTLLGPHGDAQFYGKVKKNLQNALLIHMRRDGMPDDSRRDYFLNLLPDVFLLLAKEWTNHSQPDFIDIHNITEIASTIRIGSLYRSYVETVHSLEKKKGQNKNQDNETNQTEEQEA